MRRIATRIRVTHLAAVVSIAALATALSDAPGGASPGSGAPFSGSLRTNPLVISSAEGIIAGQEAAAQMAKRANPFAALARQRSRSAYADLAPSAVPGLLQRSFPAIISQRAGGAPTLPAGSRVIRYRTAHAAQIALPNRGFIGILESAVPIAKRSGHGQYTPIDLALKTSGAGFAPNAPLVHVAIPRQLSAGVAIAANGVGLTQVDGHGRPLSGTGRVDGASVVYPATGPSSDTIAKPTLYGFRLDSVLRSADSPQRLYFEVNTPPGSKLREARHGGSVTVLRGGDAIATISAPAAEDSDQVAVPTSMRLIGRLLVVEVEHRSGGYLYPIEVDPEVNDSQLAEQPNGKISHWKFETKFPTHFEGKSFYETENKGLPEIKERLETKGIAEYGPSESAFWGYETKGVSKIYEIKASVSAKNSGSKIESFFEFVKPSGAEETKKLLSTEVEGDTEYEHKPAELCAEKVPTKEPECLPAAGEAKNAVHFQQSTTEKSAKYSFSDSLNEAIVSISAPAGTHSTTSFNTESPELEFEIVNEGIKERIKRKNALYGSGLWLTKAAGALKTIAKDPGIGVAASKLEYESAPKVWTLLSKHEYLEKECEGVQCYEKVEEYWTLDPKLPDGEQKLRYRAEDAMPGTVSLETEGQANVKVDTAKPHSLQIIGLPFGDELSEKPYELTGAAADGEGTTVASSGIKSLSLYVDGHQFGTSGGSCTIALGECTASDKWTINGAELGAGHHAIVLVAVDNAGNEARKEWTLSIRHSTPVALGPGSVDLQSGTFAFGATDVSMGSGLTFSRSFSSRNLSAGQTGPLGPEWSTALTSGESLAELADGGVLLTDATGGQSIFAPIGGGKFESPNGDANLQLTLEEKEGKKTAYYLKDETKHTSLKFTQTVANGPWLPTIQEGTVATDTVTFKYQTADQYSEYSLPSESRPGGMTAGPDGNIWFTEWGTNKVASITPAGMVTEYAASATKPENIVALESQQLLVFEGSSTINTIDTHGKVVAHSLSFTPGKLAVGPDGRVWSYDFVGNTLKATKIEGETAATSTYTAPAGSKPLDVAVGPDGDLWYVFNGTSKVAKVNASGAILKEYALTAGSKPTQIVAGSDKNLWIWEETAKKFVKMSTEGTVLGEYAVPTEVFVKNMVEGGDGNVWFVNDVNAKNELDTITTAGVITQHNLPEIAPDTLTVGADGNIWYGGEFPSKIGVAPKSGYTVEPKEVLAPKPAGVSCEPEMKAGCRALKFVYSSSTTATGLNSSQWGTFRGRLAKVLLNAYEPVSKKMVETAVAEYSYDNLGRLRAEWDPRISPALKTTYGYDAEGHVTALDPPGQEPWLFTYGTIASDAGTGRLLKVARGSASEGLWGGEVPVNTEVPRINGRVEVQATLNVWKAKWSGSPVVYGYQWLRCDTKGSDCVRILGANNGDYKPMLADVGHQLVAVVTATNGGGSTAAVTAASKTVEVRKMSGFELPAGSHPYGITSGPEGNIWFTDAGTGKIGELPVEGISWVTKATEFTAEKFEPYGIASGPDKNLWFIEHSFRHADRMTPSGSFTVRELPKLTTGVGMTAGPDGNMWFTASAGNYIGKLNVKDEVLAENAVASGGKPYGITAGPDGNIWFANNGNDKIGKMTTGGTVTEYALPSGSKPYWIATGPDGNLWFTDNGTSKVGKITTSGTVTEYALPAGSQPRGITSGPGSNLYVAEFGTNKIATVTTSGTITETTVGTEPSGITQGSDGSLWITAYGWNAILRYNPKGLELSEGEGETVAPQPGFTINYGVPLSGAGLPTMTASEVAKWGQEDVPTEATAITAPDEPQRWPATGYKRANVYYLDENGRSVNVSSPSNAMYGSVATTEYNELNDVVRTLSADNRQKALEAGSSESVKVAKLLSTYFTYEQECSKPSESKEETESGVLGGRLCATEGPQHTIKYVEGSEHREALARLHTKYFYDEKAPSGESYNLKTKETTIAELANEEEREVRKTTFSYSGQSNLGWKLRAPTSVTVDPEGKKLTTTTLYNSATGQVSEVRPPAGAGGGSAHDQKLIYYSAEANTEGYSSCGLHPEWAGLVCETLPAKQPEAGTAALPVTTVTYNMWNEPETAVETFGSTTRTKKHTYDGGGRMSTSETTSTADTALPKVTDEYNSSTGLLEKQSTTVESKTKTLTSKYNTLGQLTEYTDADGNTAKYLYAGESNDWLLEEVSDGSSEGSGKQVYSYDTTTKLLEKLLDSSAGTFTASYDAEGKLTSEVYPNAMCAKTSYDAAGEATQLEYIKTSNCSESGAPVWYSETLHPSVRGEMYDRTSTLASESYFYDSVGRLTETQETPTGEGCSERLYGYDEESNRTSQTTRTPGTGGKCATEGGTVLSHSYDEANRLKDAGIAYDTFGNVTKLPAADAEGHELTSTFYVDNAVATQSQNGVTNNYYLDPEGRTRETVTGSTTVIDHYDGPGEAVVWTSEGAGKGTRNVPGIDGSLAAVQTNGETPVLQLHDLQGDIVATASLSSEATKLLSTYNSTEFGVPKGEKAPPKYAWLGASDVASAFSTGVITYGSTSYVPQTGRALQSEAVDPPGIPGGSGAGGPYRSQMEPWNMQAAEAEAAEAPGLEAAREREAMEEAIAAELAAGGVDPHTFFLQGKALKIGEKLNAIHDWSEFWSAATAILGLVDLPGAVVSAVVGYFTWGEIEFWLHNAGGKLEQCGKKTASWVAGCEFKWKTISILGVSFVDPWSLAEVEKCGTYTWYDKKHLLKEAWECRRLNEAAGPV